MPSSPRRRLLAAAAAAVTVAALSFTGGAVASAVPLSPVDSFPSARPSWAKASAEDGSTPSGKQVEGEIVFSLRDRAGATDIAQAVSTPGSPLYGKYLTPAEWIARFSPRESVFDRTLRYLKRNGLTITGTPKSRLFISFRGRVDTFEDLFHTDLKQYRHGGKVLIAPSTTPSMPDSVSAPVAGLYLGTARLATRPRAAAAEPAPGVSLDGYKCSHYWQQHSFTLPEAYGTTEFPTANCGYLGSQFRSVYHASKSMTGAGQTVATVLWYGSPTLKKDYATFVERNGGIALTSATYSETVAKKFYDVKNCGGVGGAQGEQVLDVTAIHGIAPKARVHYFGAYNCGTGIDVSVSSILDDRLATIVSNSYGYAGELPAAAAQITENQYMQAVAEGIGMYFSSGDLGDDAAVLGARSADYPASSPWVTAVGGTTTEIGRTGRAELETGWGNSYAAVLRDEGSGALSYATPPPGDFASGAGGGESAVFARPWYQDGTVSTAGRSVPDVAAIGDPRTGERIGLRLVDDESGKSLPYGEQIIGGTSLSSPLFAAEVALVQQKTHRTFGFLNPLVYAASLAGTSPLKDVLSNDVAVAYNDQDAPHFSYLVTGNTDTSLTVAPGWDPVTGLGVLRLNRLAKGMR